LPHYGHRCGTVPLRLHDAWWVCPKCMPDFVPTCGICSKPAPIVDRQPGFVGHAYGKLCPACVTKVKAAGPWRVRRMKAVEARRDALLARFPGLAVVRVAPAVIMLKGQVDGRQVEVRLRVTTTHSRAPELAAAGLATRTNPGDVLCDRRFTEAGFSWRYF
jgi:hypothetical protein